MEKKKIHLQPSHIKVFNFVKKYVAKNIVAPEVHEIAGGIKMSMRHVYRTVDDLVELGYMTKDAYAKRSIKIVKEIAPE